MRNLLTHSQSTNQFTLPNTFLQKTAWKNFDTTLSKKDMSNKEQSKVKTRALRSMGNVVFPLKKLLLQHCKITNQLDNEWWSEFSCNSAFNPDHKGTQFDPLNTPFGVWIQHYFSRRGVVQWMVMQLRDWVAWLKRCLEFDWWRCGRNGWILQQQLHTWWQYKAFLHL